MINLIKFFYFLLQKLGVILNEIINIFTFG